VYYLEFIVLKSMIEGVHLAVYSSIKPATIHRLTLEYDALSFISNTIAISDYIVEAYRIGEKARRGELALTSIEIGKLLSKSLREAYRWVGSRVHPSVIVPQIIYSLAFGHSGVENYLENNSKIRNSLNLILSINKWSEIRQFIDALKSIGRNDMLEHLNTAGLSQLTGVTGGVNFGDVFRILGSRWYAFTSLDLSDYKIYNLVKRLIEYYEIYKSAENALVALYLELIKNRVPEWARQNIVEVLEKKLIGKREGFKILFDLDMKLRRDNIFFKEYIGLLAITAGIAIFDGMRL